MWYVRSHFGSSLLAFLLLVATHCARIQGEWMMQMDEAPWIKTDLQARAAGLDQALRAFELQIGAKLALAKIAIP